MENKPQNVFDKLDKQGEKIEEILEILKNTESRQKTVTQQKDDVKYSSNENNTKKVDDQLIINEFKKKARKQHVWFGPIKDFKKAKLIAIIVGVALIIVGVISIILPSFSDNHCSTFSIIEGIWLVAAIFMFSHLFYAKKRMLDIDLKMHSTAVFEQDSDGTWRMNAEEKKKYKWLRRISYIAVACNIIMIWVFSKGTLAVAATIFEILFLGLSIGFYFAYDNLFIMYGNIIFYTSNNLSTTVTLVYDVFHNQLVAYDFINEKVKEYL